jgi:hypothetical protein
MEGGMLPRPALAWYAGIAAETDALSMAWPRTALSIIRGS